MTDDEFLDAFERAAITRAQWTHAAHVRMAWIYARRAPDLNAAVSQMRAGIPKLNAALGTAPHLYHDTVTCAFGTIVYAAATAPQAARTWTEFEAAHPEFFDKSAPILHRYYDPATLATDAARTGFVAPDRAGFPAVLR
jgi:hypothetical protein